MTRSEWNAFNSCSDIADCVDFALDSFNDIILLLVYPMLTFCV